MAAPEGGKLWFLVLCATAALPAITAGEGEPRVFSIACCQVLPNRTHVYHVKCDCMDQSLTFLRGGDFPKSVQSVTIATRSNMTIHREAIYELTSLVELQLYDMDVLEVHAEGLKLAPESRRLTFSVDNVRDVEFFGYAFSGHWTDQAKIRIQATKKTAIRSNAFAFTTTDAGPSLSLKLIDQLWISTAGISAKIGYLEMIYSKMPVCEDGGLGTHIRRIEMKNVTIDEAREGCVRGSGALTKLSISASKLGTIQPKAFTGHIAEVTLENTSVTTVKENGFQLKANRFELNGSNFSYLEPNSLSIEAKRRISLDDVNVQSLHGNALSGLKINQENPDVESIIIRNLNISHADNGSLAFADGVKVTLYNLFVRSPFLCPVEEWARMLVTPLEYSTSNPFNQPQREVLHQLRPRIMCDDPTHPTLIPTTQSVPADVTEESAESDDVKEPKVASATLGSVRYNYPTYAPESTTKNHNFEGDNLSPPNIGDSTKNGTLQDTLLYVVVAISFALFVIALGFLAVILIRKLTEPRYSVVSQGGFLSTNRLLNPRSTCTPQDSQFSSGSCEGSVYSYPYAEPRGFPVPRDRGFPMSRDLDTMSLRRDLRVLQRAREAPEVISIESLRETLQQPTPDAVLRRRLLRTGSLTRSVSAER